MPNNTRMAAAGLVVLALLCTLLLALLDWSAAGLALAGLIAGAVLVLLLEGGRWLYRNHRTWLLAGAAAVGLALLVVLRPDGRDTDGDQGPAARVASAYAAELWPRRAAVTPSFILRETVSRVGEAPIGGSAVLEPVRTGLIAHEIRFAPGAATDVAPVAADDGAAVSVVINPLDDGRLLQVPGADLSKLPGTEASRATLASLPGEVRVSYLGEGAGWARALLAPVLPLRSLSPFGAILLFGIIGALAALAWRDAMVDVLRRRAQTPAKPARTGGDYHRAPLVPRSD